MFGKKEKRRRRRVIKANYGNNKLERYTKRRKIQASFLEGVRKSFWFESPASLERLGVTSKGQGAAKSLSF